jgi:2-C-methyl-D-erythritol 4-phosphate cytidylyltransferase
MSPSSPAASPPDVGVLLAAGGRGARAGPGELKQFRALGGVPMLLRALRPFAQHPAVGEIVVALPAPFAAEPPPWLAEVVGGSLKLVAGGANRSASVRAALDALDPRWTIVLVHDAARPFVSPETIEAVIAVVARGVAAVPGVAVTDTLKRVATGTAQVVETVDRRHLWRAHTPQGFPRAMLEQAFAREEPAAAFTDEAALVEAAGFPVEVVPDHPSNIKVTSAADFALAEAMLVQ